MSKITVQDLIDIGLKGEGDDLLVLANNINILLEANDIKMLVDEVVDYVMNGGTTLQQKYDELLEDYRTLSYELDELDSSEYY